MRNIDNILRHELIGLDCTVKDARNRDQKNVTGKIVDETMKFIIIGEERKKIPKEGTVFSVRLSGKIVDIDGSFLLSRPEDRIKKKIKKW